MSIVDEIKSYFGCGSSGKELAIMGHRVTRDDILGEVEKIRFNIAETSYQELPN